MDVLFTDFKQPNLHMEYELLEGIGLDVSHAQCRNPEEVIQKGRGARMLIANSAPITRKVFERLDTLEMVSAVGIGVDHIDTQAAREHGVWVGNVPDANVNEVATHALAMSLSLIRRLPQYDKAVHEGKWDKRAVGVLQRPSKLHFGILGLGHIGRALATMVRPIFNKVLAHDPYCEEGQQPDHVTLVGLETLFAQSDVVSVHVPLNEATHHLVNGQILAHMSGGYLVNTARGGIVCEQGLLDAFEDGSLAGAALDVLPVEPPPADSPLLQHPNILLSPHAAFYSAEAEDSLRLGAIENVKEWVSQARLSRPVVEGKHMASTPLSRT